MKRFVTHILLIAIIAIPVTISKGAEMDKGKVSDYLFARGYRAFSNGDFAGAARIFRKVTHRSILYDYSLYYLGESLLELRDYQGAGDAFKRLVGLKKKSRLKDDAELRLAELYLLKGDYRGAESILESLLKREGAERPAVLSLLGRVYRARGEVKKAFKAYLALWRDHPDSPPAYGIEDSIRSIRRLYKEASISPVDRFKRIESLIRASMLKEARDELEMLERMFVSIDDDWTGRLARTHFRLRDMDGAALWYKRLLTTKSDALKQEALFRLARISLRRKDTRHAYRLFKRLYRRYPEGDYAVSALLNMAVIDSQRGDRTSAIKTLKKAVREYPESPLKPYLVWQIAWLSYRVGRYRDAAAYLNTLKDDDSYHDLATFWLAKTVIKMGEKDKGIGMLTSLSQKQPPTYYTVMAGVILKRYNHHRRVSPRPSDRGADDIAGRSPVFKKSRLLLSLGFSGLARDEVLSTIEEEGDLGPSEIIEAAYLLQRSGDYYDALTLVEGQGGFDDIGIWRLAYPLGYRDIVTMESRAVDIDPFLVYAVIREESSFDPESISSSNAIGLMQILPSTAEDIIDRSGYDKDFDGLDDLKTPAKNIGLGVRYLASLLDSFHGDIPLSLAAYNGGAGNVRRWLNERKGLRIEEFIEEIPFGETRRYVKKVLRAYAIYRQIYSNDEVALKLTTDYGSID